MSQPLATVEDAAVRIGRALDDTETARLAALLTDASARIRTYMGAAALDYPILGPVTQTAKVRRGGLVRLGLEPVTGVSAVRDPWGNGLPYMRWHTAGLIVGLPGTAVINWPGDIDEYDSAGWMPWWLPSQVEVDYTAGYNPLPEVVTAVCCQAAIRALQQYAPIMPNASGAGVANYPPPGGVWLMSDEKAALDQAVPRVPLGPISLYGATAPEPSY